MDWAVLIGWAADGHYQWFYLSLTIQILSGLLSAGILIWELLDHMNGYVAGAISLIFGIGGFGPWVMVILALYTQQVRDAHASIELTKNIMLMELIFETLPQSMLQGYVAISYSMLDPINNADHFSALLFASLAMSVFHASLTVFDFEILLRKETSGLRLTTVSRYGCLSVAARTAQSAALISAVALMFCAFKTTGAIFMGIAMLVFSCLACEGGLRSKPGRSAAADLCQAVCSAVCFLIVISIWGLIFAAENSHRENNYGNITIENDGAEMAFLTDLKRHY